MAWNTNTVYYRAAISLSVVWVVVCLALAFSGNFDEMAQKVLSEEDFSVCLKRVGFHQRDELQLCESVRRASRLARNNPWQDFVDGGGLHWLAIWLVMPPLALTLLAGWWGSILTWLARLVSGYRAWLIGNRS